MYQKKYVRTMNKFIRERKNESKRTYGIYSYSNKAVQVYIETVRFFHNNDEKLFQYNFKPSNWKTKNVYRPTSIHRYE